MIYYSIYTFIAIHEHHLPVSQHRHLAVCARIPDACSAVQTQLLEGVVRCIIVIYNQDARVIERYGFDSGSLPVVPKEEALTEFER